MSAPIETYALVGDCRSAALVGLDGSVDWLCWPRFDSDACFAALLGTPANGRWLIRPKDHPVSVSRRYRKDTLILETSFTTNTGKATLIDFMTPHRRGSHLVRLLRGVEGEITMGMELILRFGYGAAIPWVTRGKDGALQAVAGPDMTVLRTPVALRSEDFKTSAVFTVTPQAVVPFVLSYGPSHLTEPPAIDALQALKSCESSWRGWSARASVSPPYDEAVMRSLITLKGLTYAPSGGIVAAPTASLPENIGGARNWDYRYCWIRDSTFTLLGLMNAGFYEEAGAWRDWLLRAAAGAPASMQIMYGLMGERRLTEWEADWLPGYLDSHPVRFGNAAHRQFQLDVYGELMDSFAQARTGGLAATESGWALQLELVRHVTQKWREPDYGIWETRGPPRHFTFSKVMAWVTLDRAIRAVERHGLPGDAPEWRNTRDTIHDEICERGFDAGANTFRAAYDSVTLDASLLLLAQVGFLDGGDPRFAGTVAAVERELLVDGFVMRYDTGREPDGLHPGEGAFLACSFWLADAYLTLGRRDEAQALFERLLALANDVGLLAEEFDIGRRRLVGNFPQAFSHVALINTAFNLTQAAHPSEQRAGKGSVQPRHDGPRRKRQDRA